MNLALISPMDAPATAGLSLILQPTAFFASTTSRLTLTVSVPIGGNAVTLSRRNFIAVTLPAADAIPAPQVSLVTTINGITANTNSGLWTVLDAEDGVFKIVPTAPPITLNAGDSFQAVFEGLNIVSQTGSPSVLFTVNTSEGSEDTSLPVSIQEQVPGIIAWADPPVVAVNTSILLRWSANGGAIVRVTGYTSGPTWGDFPVNVLNDPTVPLSQQPWVNPTVDGNGESQHTYTLQLLTSPGNKPVGASFPVTVYQHRPYIGLFGFVQPDNSVQPKITINLGQQVTAKWDTIFVDPEQGILLTYGTQQIPNAPVSEFDFDPSTALSPNGSQVTVYLQAPGWKETAQAEAVVTFTPIKIRYFKYSTWTTDKDGDHFANMVFDTIPPSPFVNPSLSPAPNQGPNPPAQPTYQLSVQGPGGPLTQYLGVGDAPYLQIRYFAPVGTVTKGKAFTLQWFTHNATELSLTAPDGTVTNITANKDKGTSDPFTLTDKGTFVLTANGSIQSFLDIVPA